MTQARGGIVPSVQVWTRRRGESMAELETPDHKISGERGASRGTLFRRLLLFVPLLTSGCADA
ncbi:MAG TPA: hypothetical protein DIT48_13415 [Actinobacteria bacterium]|nr:hypothetical protein [Actinomycetota bacterium]HCP62627.1 hypothetical protein [Actinomycetota bacterium]